MFSNTNQFYVSCFSDQSNEVYPMNTSSQFVCQFEREIELENAQNWEVALSNIFIPPIKRVESQKETDEIKFNTVDGSKTLNSLDSFLEYCITSATNVETYHKNYFAKYLNRATFYDFSTLNKDFKDDYVTTVNAEKTLNFKITLNEFMEDGIYAGFAIKKEGLQSFASITLTELDVYIPISAAAATTSYRMHQIIQLIMRHFDHKFKDLKFEHDYTTAHANNFDSISENKSIFKAFMSDKEYRKNVLFNLISSIARKFQASKKTPGQISHESAPSLLTIYTDVIQERYFGQDLCRVIYFTSASSATFEFKSIVPEQFFPVSNHKFQAFAFKITDENGEDCQFEKGYPPLCLTLNFRRK